MGSDDDDWSRVGEFERSRARGGDGRCPPGLVTCKEALISARFTLLDTSVSVDAAASKSPPEAVW